MEQSGSGPLDGVRVIAIEQYGAGPLATMFLADMGAEIIKVEDPSVGGDVSRYIPPGQVGSDSLFFESFNRGKKSMVLDLKSQGGREVLEALVASAHAVYTNLRGDQPVSLGINYAQLGKINPAIVCVSLTGYGSSDSSARLPGYDALIQAEAGWAAVTGEPDGPPTKSGLSLADYIGGIVSALGMVIALFDSRRTGLGRDVETSLYDVALSMLTYPATWYLSRGFTSQRQTLSAHPSVVPFQFFGTSDGYIAVACPKEKFFRSLMVSLGLQVSSRFASFEERRRNSQELRELLAGRFRQATTDEWIDRLRGIVPVAPVRSMEEALDLDDLHERNMVASYEHESLGAVTSVGNPLQFQGFAPTYREAPRLDRDREEILVSLGYSKQDVRRLEAEGAFGATN